MTALVIDRLAKNFGGLQALCDLSLEIQPGERRVILGPNGAGKTTLFHLIGGQLSPSSGSASSRCRPRSARKPSATRWPPAIA